MASLGICTIVNLIYKRAASIGCSFYFLINGDCNLRKICDILNRVLIVVSQTILITFKKGFD